MIKKLISQIPNSITCLSAVCGFLSVWCSFHGTATVAFGLSGFHAAMALIGIAALCDFLDGASARLLRAYSELGKQLDSLSDLVSFGVAPGMLALNVVSQSASTPWIAWLAVLIPVLGEIRLAKFNIDDRQTTSFRGLPIPANAIFWIGACYAILAGSYPGDSLMASALVIVPSLMVATPMKMFSLKFKNFSLAENWERYVMIAAAVAAVSSCGVSGLAWAIIIYVILSLVTASRR